MGFIRLEIEAVAAETQAILTDKLTHDDERRTINEFVNYLGAVKSGNRRGIVRQQVCGVAASGTIGCDESDAVDDTDTVTIGATTLAVVETPADEDEFAAGATDITFAANLATAINDHSVAGEMYFAESDGVDTVTVTCRVAGAIGNEVALAEVGNGFTLGAAALAGGTNAAMKEMDFGLTR